MPGVRPWTQSVVLAWGPQLTFYEQKLVILRSLEDAGTLVAFRVENDEVAARVGDRDHELVVQYNELAVRILRPDADEERMRAAAKVAIEMLGRPRVRAARADLKYLIPLETDYESSRLATAHTLLGVGEMSEMGGWDWSVLLDGKAEGALEFQVEFGIVSADEVPLRLSGAGRVGAESGTPPPNWWEDVEFPDVGLYAHFQWNTSTLETKAPADAFLDEVWSAIHEHSSNLLKRLLVAITPGNQKGDGY